MMFEDKAPLCSKQIIAVSVNGIVAILKRNTKKKIGNYVVSIRKYTKKAFCWLNRVYEYLQVLCVNDILNFKFFYTEMEIRGRLIMFCTTRATNAVSVFNIRPV